MKNYYELLEVNPRASREIIEKAYKILAKKCHPDLYVGEERIYAEKKLRDLNEAYHVLSDDFLREQYDIELEKEINARNRVEQKQVKNYNNSKKIENAEKHEKPESQEINNHKVGSFMAIVDIVREIFKKRKHNKTVKTEESKKRDLMAAGITAVIVIVLGIILWFIPATNGFMRSLIIF